MNILFSLKAYQLFFCLLFLICTPRDIRGIANLTGLKYLHLKNSDISFDGLKNSVNLESLHLSGNYVKEQLERIGEIGFFKKDFQMEIQKKDTSLKEHFQKRFPRLNIKVLDY